MLSVYTQSIASPCKASATALGRGPTELGRCRQGGARELGQGVHGGAPTAKTSCFRGAHMVKKGKCTKKMFFYLGPVHPHGCT